MKSLSNEGVSQCHCKYKLFSQDNNEILLRLLNIICRSSSGNSFMKYFSIIFNISPWHWGWRLGPTHLSPTHPPPAKYLESQISAKIKSLVILSGLWRKVVLICLNNSTYQLTSDWWTPEPEVESIMRWVSVSGSQLSRGSRELFPVSSWS